MPIGNLTSQIFANIYLNELDQFIKHQLKIKFYLRYCDDFIILANNQEELQKLINPISFFLNQHLKLSLHENKVIIRKFKQGFDFLGYVTLLHYQVLRTTTKKRMLKRVNQNNLASYLGLLKHCQGFKLKKQILDSQSSWE